MKGFSQNFICALVLILEVTVCKTRGQKKQKCGRELCKEPLIKVGPKNHTARLAELVTLKCKAQGNPPPTVLWYKNNVRIDQHNRDYQITSKPILKSGRKKGVVRSQLQIQHVTNKDYALYYCEASNKIGDSPRSKDAFLTIHPEQSINPMHIPGSTSFKPSTRQKQCYQYKNGTTCKMFLDPSRSIYTDRGTGALFMAEKMLKTLADSLKNSQVNHLSERCKPFAIPFLCYYNFPYCSTSDDHPTKVNICKKDCIELSELMCQAEFQKAKKDETLQKLIPKECSSLPDTNCLSVFEERRKVTKIFRERNNLASRSNLPSKSNKLNVKQQPATDDLVDTFDNCFYDRGVEYRGTENTTQSGSCMSWSNAHDKRLPYLSGHNYCRNPEGSRKSRPWCYVEIGGNPRSEYCNIPRCAMPVRSQASSILYTIVPCLLFALAVSLAVIMLAWRRHKQHFYQSAPYSPKSVVPRVNPKIQELNREDLCDFRLIGDGNIGRVYTADFTGSKDGRAYTACVAVKAIIEKASSKQIEDFVREAETRASFKHENIVSLIGVISKEEPLSLIYEYTEYGDLHEYLLRHTPNYSDAHANDDCEPLEYSDLLVIATQIASGMSYLSTHAFVHKDLAARNCLVADNGIIKISDFSGLCDMYAGDYYRTPGRAPLPIRWMSPESISQFSFSSASDVWSYGVVLWEIFSYGSRPFFGLSNYQAMQRIMEFNLLSCPEGCPKVLFEIMVECWLNEPNVRPTFVEIYNKLKSMNDMTKCPANMQMYPGLSMHSLPPTVTIPNGHVPIAQSLHSRHSSNHSINSSHHPASMHSTVLSIPPSLSSIPRSMPFAMMNGYPPSSRNGHHSLLHDGRRSLSRDEHFSLQRDGHRSLSSRDGHHSLPRDGHHSVPRDCHHSISRDLHCSLQHGDVRPPSANSSHHPLSSVHIDGYHPAASYVSTLPSYPPSPTCPPASSVFSRHSSSRASSGPPSVRSCDSGRDGSVALSSHYYL